MSSSFSLLKANTQQKAAAKKASSKVLKVALLEVAGHVVGIVARGDVFGQGFPLALEFLGECIPVTNRSNNFIVQDVSKVRLFVNC
jgi:hypothetical protein